MSEYYTAQDVEVQDRQQRIKALLAVKQAKLRNKLQDERQAPEDFGAPAQVRFAVGNARSPKEKLATLQKFFPMAAPTARGDNFVYIDPESGKKVLYNEPGLDLGDVAGSARTLAQIGVPAALSAVPGVGAVARNPVGAAAISTATGEGVDALARGAGTVDNRTAGQQLKGAATGFTGEAVLGAAFPGALNAARRIFARPEASSVMRAADAARVQPSMGMLARTPFRMLEQAQKSVPGSGHTIENVQSRAVRQTNAAVNRVADQTGNVRRTSGPAGTSAREFAGDAVQEAFDPANKQGVAPFFRDRSSQIFKQVDQFFTPEDSVKMNKTVSTVEDVKRWFGRLEETRKRELPKEFRDTLKDIETANLVSKTDLFKSSEKYFAPHEQIPMRNVLGISTYVNQRLGRLTNTAKRELPKEVRETIADIKQLGGKLTWPEAQYLRESLDNLVKSGAEKESPVLQVGALKDALTKDMEEALTAKGGAAAQSVIDANTPTHTVTWQEADRLRKSVGEMIGSPSPQQDASERQMRRLYDALTADQEAAVLAKGGRAKDLWNRAKQHRRGFEQRMTLLRTLTKEEDPVKAYEKVTKMSAPQLRTLKRSLTKAPEGQQAWDDLVATRIYEMGRSTPGQTIGDVIEEGSEEALMFSPGRFATAFNEMRKGGQDKVLFDGALRREMHNLYNVASAEKMVGAAANFPNTAAHVFWQNLITWGSVASVGGPAVSFALAKGMQRPSFVRWMAQGLGPKGKNVAVHLGRLQGMAARDPFLQPIADQLTEAYQAQAQQEAEAQLPPVTM